MKITRIRKIPLSEQRKILAAIALAIVNVLLLVFLIIIAVDAYGFFTDFIELMYLQ